MGIVEDVLDFIKNSDQYRAVEAFQPQDVAQASKKRGILNEMERIARTVGLWLEAYANVSNVLPEVITDALDHWDLGPPEAYVRAIREPGPAVDKVAQYMYEGLPRFLRAVGAPELPSDLKPEEFEREMENLIRWGKTYEEARAAEIEDIRRKIEAYQITAKELGLEERPVRRKREPIKYTEEQKRALLDAFSRIFSERREELPSPEREKKAAQRIREMEQLGFSIERAFKEIEKFAREQAAIRTPDEAAQVAEKIRNLFVSQYRSLLHEDPPFSLSQSIYETAKDMALEGRPYSEIVEWMERIVRERARAQRATRARGALAGYVERLERLAFGGARLGRFYLAQRVRVKKTGQVGQIYDAWYDEKEEKWVYRVEVKYDPYNPLVGLSLTFTEDELEPA